MAKRKPATKATQKSAKSPTATKKRYEGFTDEERGAMKDRVQEQKVASQKADGESEVLAKIAEMREPDRAMAKRVHAIIKASAPGVREGRQGRLLLSERAEVQVEVRDVRVQRRRAPRRRRYVASRLRADEVDDRRRGKNRGAREEGGELRAELASHALQDRGEPCARSIRMNRKESLDAI